MTRPLSSAPSRPIAGRRRLAPAIAALLALACLAPAAQAQGKISGDLGAVLQPSGPNPLSNPNPVYSSGGSAAPKSGSDAQQLLQRTWFRRVNGETLVQAIVYATPQARTGFADLRAAVLAGGGSVRREYPALSALAVVAPAQVILKLAERDDVRTISPNRLALRTATVAAPFLPAPIGPVDRIPNPADTAVAPLPLATGTTGVSASTPRGAGVTIAVLDSGVMGVHKNFLGAQGRSRIVSAVDLTRDLAATWALRIDTSSQSKEDCLRPNPQSGFADANGHGTHVASVAAGSGDPRMQANNPRGIAPEAQIFDVRVLDHAGIGQIDEVLAGIDCAIRRSAELGVRVMNLSIASDASESYVTDPL
jgi:subtilisin family serine protease